MFKGNDLREILLRRALVTEDQLSGLEDIRDGRLGTQLIQNGIIDKAQLATALAEQFNLPYVSLDGFVVARELFRELPVAECYKNLFLPYRMSGDVLEVVISDPYDLSLIDRIEAMCGRRVKSLLSTRGAIDAALKRSQGEVSALDDISDDFRLVVAKDAEEGDGESVSLENIDEQLSPVIRLVNTLLVAALSKRASDIHIETHEHGVTVKYRIDGVLYPATEMLDRSYHSALVSRLKVMAELDIAERRIPQDGRFKLRSGGRDIDFRVSIMPGVFGEDVVIRILDKSAITMGMRELNLDGLSMDASVRTKFRRKIRDPYGLVLITGPTGSGKTTTLYAALSEINSGEEKIVTIEDPVEYQLNGILQIPVNEKKGLTFARGLRSILRHDPDKIMVGEIRDPDTAMIAVQSALTGHLVFTTVHANNAFDVIGRFSHMGVDIYGFVSALNCVVSQRLVRLICAHCRRETKVEPDYLEMSGLNPGQYARRTWYEGAGCDHCSGTGYRGRAAIMEYLDMSPDIRQMIVDRRPAKELQAAALKEGMLTLRQSALSKVFSGETTLKEINRVTFVD
ncbi:MAG TPA: GspE/PulE family protein [Sideroxyarcus sp.]|nr:GspE/PulE family protein [Sideroxyarcus sp.]